MKKIIAVFSAVVCAAAMMTVLSACGGAQDAAKETGNKIVSEAQSYLQSELGVDGDVSKLASSAGEYLQNELGLNNADNQVLEGTWVPSHKTTSDWQWTFDGKNGCTLSSKLEQASANGTYDINVSEGNVRILLETWDEPITFTYKLQKTLSAETLILSSETQGYSLTKQ